MIRKKEVEEMLLIGFAGIIILLISRFFCVDVTNKKARIIGAVLFFLGIICLCISLIICFYMFNKYYVP